MSLSPYIISGPCSAESERQILDTALSVAPAGANAFRAGLWKPRTHPGMFEGVGDKGLAWLKKARSETGLPIGTEVASRRHVEAVLDAGLDFVWIGARTTPNPFMVQEIAESLSGSGLKVWIKNPVSQDIELWVGAVERLQACGITDPGLIFRGFQAFDNVSGRNAARWMQAIEMRTRFPQLQMLCDPSHMAGDTALVPSLAARAMNLGMDGLMIEAHCCPQEALSDSNQQLTPAQLAELIDNIKLRRGNSDAVSERLSVLRDNIDELDARLLEILSSRMRLSDEIGMLKRECGMPIIQPERWDRVMKKALSDASGLGLQEDFVKSVFRFIHEASVNRQ